MKVLLGQLGSNGDCLYATTLARQLKADYPGCHLTWAVASCCAAVLRHNPYIDALWQWEVHDWHQAWRGLTAAVLRIQQSSNPFDKVLLSQIAPENVKYFDGTVRPSIFRSYHSPITVPVDSVIALADEEKDAVARFATRIALDAYPHRILFECSSKSGQSFVSPGYAQQVAEKVSSVVDDCCFVLSTHEQISSKQNNIFSARELSIRENAELTHHCSLFVGCGSGLTVVATSEAAKPLPNIQLLAAKTSVFGSFFHDYEFWGKPTERFIERGESSVEETAAAIICYCREGLDVARAGHHRPVPLAFDFYLNFIDTQLVQRCRYVDALESLTITAARYGWDAARLRFVRARVLPLLKYDAAHMDRRRRSEIDQLVSAVPRA